MKRILQDERVLMNTKISFLAYTDIAREKVYNIFRGGFKEFEYVVKNFSRFEDNNQLAKLNKSNGKKIKVSEELFHLVEFSLKIARESNGLFDPTIIDILEAYGFNKNHDFSKLKTKQHIKKEIINLVKSRPSYKRIKLDKNNLTIKLAKNQRLDLGSLAKGYAIDLAYKKLLPLKNFIINAGGDIRVKGKNKRGQNWIVGLIDPDNPENAFGSVSLEDKALACSGPSARKISYFHHLVNPKDGKPIKDFKISFVIADDAITADAFATVVFTSGELLFDSLYKSNIAALFIDDKDQLVKTPNFNEIKHHDL